MWRHLFMTVNSLREGPSLHHSPHLFGTESTTSVYSSTAHLPVNMDRVGHTTENPINSRIAILQVQWPCVPSCRVGMQTFVVAGRWRKDAGTHGTAGLTALAGPSEAGVMSNRQAFLERMALSQAALAFWIRSSAVRIGCGSHNLAEAILSYDASAFQHLAVHYRALPRQSPLTLPRT